MRKEIEQLRQKFQHGRQNLFRHVDWKSPSRNLLEAHSSLIDSIILEIYSISIQDADRKAERNNHSRLAIVATGGYGRRELNPYSDVDIAFIPSEEEDPWVEAVVHTAFKLVMDVFLSLKEIQVGYSFRPLREASSWDVSVKTSLLDLRPICGDYPLAEKLKRRVRDLLPLMDLVLDITPVADSYPGQSNAIYTVEPNLKESPGGLRDLHGGRWIYKLFYGVEDKELDAVLLRSGEMSEWQIAEVREAADWFWRARNWLHVAAGRGADVLINNYQDRIARELDDCSAQTWLSQHLKYAEILEGFRKDAVQTVLLGPLEIHELRLEKGMLHLPSSISRLDTTLFAVHTSQRYSIPLSLKDLKNLRKKRNLASRVLEPSDKEPSIFKKILNEPKDVAATLSFLTGIGHMDRFVPHFSEAMRFVPPDPAHSHTVGEHSLRMVRHLEDLRAGRDREGYRFKDLLDQCSHFDILCLACLLHDIGKLLPGTDHCETSAGLVKSVAKKLNLSTEKKELLDILIRQHLLLVRTARLHDLAFANVVQKVAALVPDPDSLRHLYVFTYIDTCAVSRSNWTSMDVQELERLYRQLHDYFERTSEDARGNLGADARISLIRKKLVALHSSENEKAILKHYDAMPASYLLNKPLDEIANHMQLLDRLETERVVLDVYNRPGEDYTELTVCTPDDSRPGILSKISGVLYGSAVDILRAQAFTIEKKNSVVLDTLWIQSNGMQISEYKARKIQSALKKTLTDTMTMEQFFQQSEKTPPEGITLDSIDLRNDLSEEHTVVHIVANDITGLLYVVCNTLSICGLYIHSAKISTWQGHAEDNFYVTIGGKGQIPSNEFSTWTEKLRQLLQVASDQ